MGLGLEPLSTASLVDLPLFPTNPLFIAWGGFHGADRWGLDAVPAPVLQGEVSSEEPLSRVDLLGTLVCPWHGKVEKFPDSQPGDKIWSHHRVHVSILDIPIPDFSVLDISIRDISGFQGVHEPQREAGTAGAQSARWNGTVRDFGSALFKHWGSG